MSGAFFIVGSYYFPVSLFALALFAARGLKKRKWFIPGCVGVIAVLAGWVSLWTFAIDLPYINFLSLSTFLVQYIIVTVAIFLLHECNLWAALFCATVGYCLEHASEKLFEICMELFLEGQHVVLQEFVHTVIIVGYTAACYFLFMHKGKSRSNEFMVDNKTQTIITICIIVILVFINTSILRYCNTKAAHIMVALMAAMFAFVCLMLEFSMSSAKRNELELQTVELLNRQQNEQYIFEKGMIDVINVKCHDLKHSINAISGKASPEELDELKSAVDAYDAVFKTGNTALDVVLTRNSLKAREKKIVFTCIVDGKNLSFMPDSDIYALFGNIIDNAMEAVQSIEDEEKRSVSLTVSSSAGFVCINQTNYFSGTLYFKNGMPQTTKTYEKGYHGFGVKSIKMIAEKYGGDCVFETRGDVFVLDLLFPVS